MRSIGRKNINLVKLETERAIRETRTTNVEDLVISRLSENLWEIWEGADSEIRRIISDVCMGRK